MSRLAKRHGPDLAVSVKIMEQRGGRDHHHPRNLYRTPLVAVPSANGETSLCSEQALPSRIDPYQQKILSSLGSLMAASRNYRQATQTALTWLSDGTCYWPGCPERVIRLVNGEYKLALQVAHICAHSPGGPRYDPVMPAPDRNDFDNLILLCYVHHTTIDGTRWREYTVEILKEWKAEREAARGPALKTLGGVTEDRLQALIVDAIVSRNNEIQETLTRLERNDAQAAELLRELVNELGELRGRGSLLDPDVVSMADSAAHRLAHLQDTAGWLADAAQKLGHLSEHDMQRTKRVHSIMQRTS